MAVDLGTSYVGLKLKNPLVVAACPLTATRASLEQLESRGAAAAVLPSLFAEQIEHETRQLAGIYDYLSESDAEAGSYFPDFSHWHTTSQSYLELIGECKRHLAMPIIASLNGPRDGEWIRYARLIEEAGADALELNVYFVPTAPDETSGQIERQYVDLVAAVRETVKLPLTVKIGPYFSSLPNLAANLTKAGAQGLVLFNRFLAPDIDTESLQVSPNLVLSDRHELRLALRWIATLRDQLPISLAATGGVHFTEDVVKALLAGADIVMMAAALLRYGPRWLESTLVEVTHWLGKQEYASLAQLKGSMSLRNCADPGAYHRANYMKALVDFSNGEI